ncbi:uncharacterized protein G2W53_016200 [Senna tora]|uniref:Uncharacterized protein n=1 Tax=Senna tora TaxID=362788 RepID=A0A834WMT0_9FABA|nr:uncharacterized protein G2W53_016200 [Senna tora]
MVPSTPPLLFFFILLLTVAPTPSHDQRRQPTRLARRRDSSLIERELGLGFLSLAWSAAWDYATSFTWRGLSVKQLYGAISDMNNLLIALSGYPNTSKRSYESVSNGVEENNKDSNPYSNMMLLSKKKIEKI